MHRIGELLKFVSALGLTVSLADVDVTRAAHCGREWSVKAGNLSRGLGEVWLALVVKLWSYKTKRSSCFGEVSQRRGRGTGARRRG